MAVAFDVDPESSREDANELSFVLPDRFGPVRLHQGHFESRGARNGLWRGSVDQRADSSVALTFHDGFVAGTIRLGDDVYEVRPTADGQVVEKIDFSTFGSCAGAPDAPADTAAADAGTTAPALAAADGPAEAAAAYTIDLLSVYTPQARAAAGGASQIVATIQAAVDAANQAFANSGVSILYRLVSTAEAAHNDAGDINADLAWLYSDSATGALRNQVGADLVSLVVENGAGYCGVGFVMRSPGAGFSRAALQVSARACAVSNLSLAHEHGHNLGMEHDLANGPPPSGASYPWSFGLFVNGVFRTVMSYATACPDGCNRVPYFSNPNVTYLGYPTGIANAADNARTANLTASIAAAFRNPPPDPPPTAPTGLTATAVSPSQINLSWSDQSNNEAGFRLERSLSGGSFQLLATLGANVTSFSDTGLASATQFSYRVRAYNSAGDSANSNVATATTQQPPVPADPTGLVAAAVSSSQINLSWTDASSNESGFRIERSSGGSAFAEIAFVGANVNTYANTGLSPNTGYSYRVRAYNVYGNSGYSNTGSATTQPLPASPAAPSGLSASAASTSQINLSWVRGSTDESGFRIEQAVGGGGFTEITTVGAGVTSYANTGLTAGTAYSYRVRAYNGNGNSGYSNTAGATTQTAPAPAPAPTTLQTPGGLFGLPALSGSGANRVVTSIRLYWGDVSGETGYRIEMCKAESMLATCSYAPVTVAPANSTTYNDTSTQSMGLGVFKYRIRAENATAVSAWTETVIGTQ